MRVMPLLLAVVVALCAAGCDRSPAPGPGKAVPVPAASRPPERDARIVVLSPALAITLRDLGLAGQIVGRHGYDMVLDKAIPVCGDQAGIDYEALIRANPTHVILQWGARELPPRLTELAAEHGWIVRDQEVLSLNDIRTSAVELYDLLAGPDMQRTEDRPPKGAPSAERGAPPLVDRLRRAFSRRNEDLAGAGRVLLLLSASPAAAVGPGSFHQQVLEAIGGRVALSKGGPYQEMDTEDVANLAPDAIVLLTPRAPGTPERATPRTAEEMTKLLGPLAGKPIPAVQKGRVAVIDDPLCLMPASSMVQFADELAELLKGWAEASRR